MATNRTVYITFKLSSLQSSLRKLGIETKYIQAESNPDGFTGIFIMNNGAISLKEEIVETLRTNPNQ